MPLSIWIKRVLEHDATPSSTRILECVLEREQPGSDHARQVRFMVKKVIFREQEAILPVSAPSP